MARFVFEDEAPATAATATAPRFVFEDEPTPDSVSGGESFGRGALQGASLGFGDEAAAAIDAALPSILRNAVSDEAVGGGKTYGERYRNAREFYRAKNRAAEEANPGTYLAGSVAGAAPLAITTGGAGAAQGVGLGARVLA